MNTPAPTTTSYAQNQVPFKRQKIERQNAITERRMQFPTINGCSKNGEPTIDDTDTYTVRTVIFTEKEYNVAQNLLELFNQSA